MIKEEEEEQQQGIVSIKNENCNFDCRLFVLFSMTVVTSIVIKIVISIVTFVVMTVVTALKFKLFVVSSAQNSEKEFEPKLCI